MRNLPKKLIMFLKTYYVYVCLKAFTYVIWSFHEILSQDQNQHSSHALEAGNYFILNSFMFTKGFDTIFSDRKYCRGQLNQYR